MQHNSRTVRKKRNPEADRFEQRLDYIILTNPRGVVKMLYNNGYVVPDTMSQMKVYLKDIIKEKGESALIELLSHHPDKEILTETHAPYYPYRKKTTKGYALDKDFVGTPMEEWIGGAISGRTINYDGETSTMVDPEVERAVRLKIGKENNKENDRKRNNLCMIIILALLMILLFDRYGK